MDAAEIGPRIGVHRLDVLPEHRLALRVYFRVRDPADITSNCPAADAT